MGEACLRINEAIGYVRYMVDNAVWVLGGVAMDLHDYRQADRQFEQALRWFKELRDPWGIALSCSHLAKVALLTQDYEKAKYWLRQSLVQQIQMGRQEQEYYEALYDLNRLLTAQKRQREAVELLALLQSQTHSQTIHELATAPPNE